MLFDQQNKFTALEVIGMSQDWQQQLQLQCKNHQSQTINTSTALRINQRQESHRHLNIPLISKRMNSVEKYISQFTAKTEDVIRRRDKLDCQTVRYRHQDHSSGKQTLNHYKSVDVASFNNQDQNQDLKLQDQCCVKYNSIVDQKSEDRLEVLAKLEKDYVYLKEKMQPHKKNVTAYGTDLRRKGSKVFQNTRQQITSEQVEKEVKNAIISENGKKYFADLYLLKKGRDKIINSLSNAGKFTLDINMYEQNKNISYQEKVRANEQDFVKGKIIKDRQVKKTKMLKGRNLHWNVYYDMLALSTNEKKKLKAICKFPSTFGIV